jgi:hypothetical protein
MLAVDVSGLEDLAKCLKPVRVGKFSTVGPGRAESDMRLPG